MAFGAHVFASPVGGVVADGSAGISSSPGSTVITQFSQNVAINWQSFNIGLGESVRFIQPDSSSVALNRVLGPDPSSILGSLTANGKVFLVNPNGILFGRGAQINVGGLVASTLAISDSDFMAGRYRFAGDSTAAVLNQGTIDAPGGYVALLGANVGNDGTILARLGTVALAAGSAVTLDLAGDGLLNVTVSQGAVNALAQNGGLIQADGGQVLLTARAAGSLLQSAVNNSGVIQARTIENHQGSIRLMGDMQIGTANVGGTLDASAPDGGDGGFIETSAAHVKVQDGARLTAIAASGMSGTWLIDPVDFTIGVGGDMTGSDLATALGGMNVSISSNQGLVGTGGDIHVNDPVHWAGATTMTLTAVRDVLVDRLIKADSAGAGIAINAGHDVASALIATLDVVGAGSTITIGAGNDVRIGGAVTATAAGSAIRITAGQNASTTAALLAVAAASSIAITAGNDIQIAGAITGIAASTTLTLTAGRDVTTLATGAMSAGAAGTAIELNAGRDVKINAAVAAGTSIRLIAGLNGGGPGIAAGTVIIGGAVAAPNVTIRFNPNGYANTGTEIGLYPALSDSKAWVYAQGSNRTYDGTSAATLAFKGTPADGGTVSLIPGVATFATKNAGAGKTINFNGYALGGLDAGKFALFSSSGTTTATIAKRALIVTASGTNRAYDGTTNDQALLSDNRVAGDVLTLSYATASFADKDAGNGKAVSVAGIGLGGPDALNYSFNPAASTTADITPALVTVKASNATKTYGQTFLPSAFSTDGLAAGETIGGITLTSAGTAANASVLGGPYAITPSHATGGTFSAANYSIRYVNGSLAVFPVGLTVTAANDSKIFGESVTLTGFTLDGLVAGETIDAVTETSPGAAPTASVAGSPYVITPSKIQGGTAIASNYTVAYVNGALTVLPLTFARGVAPAQLTTLGPSAILPFASPRTPVRE